LWQSCFSARQYKRLVGADTFAVLDKILNRRGREGKPQRAQRKRQLSRRVNCTQVR
jgi:hypothetical protein